MILNNRQTPPVCVLKVYNYYKIHSCLLFGVNLNHKIHKIHKEIKISKLLEPRRPLVLTGMAACVLLKEHYTIDQSNALY